MTPKCDKCGFDIDLERERYVEMVNIRTDVKTYRCHPCDEKSQSKDYLETGMLYSSFALSCSLQAHILEKIQSGKARASQYTPCYIPEKVVRKVAADLKELESAIQLFQQRVWSSGLQHFVQKSKLKGASVTTKKVKMMTWACAGRVLITIEQRAKDPQSVTLIAAEDGDSGMGWQGISATKDVAIGLIHEIVQNSEQVMKDIEPDRKVGIGL